MKTCSMFVAAVAALALPCVVPAAGQDFNIDVGDLGGVPPAGYDGAAQQPGLWNACTESGFTPLGDLAGNDTGAYLYVCCSSGVFSGLVTGAITGPHAPLWNDSKLSSAASGSDSYTVNGVEDGIYEIYAYARDPWTPSSPQVIGGINSYTPPAACSGPWPGFHLEGVTYVRHRVAAVGGQIGVRFTHTTGSAYMAGLQVVRVSDVGQSYCVSTPNSTGAPARMSTVGGPSTYFLSAPFQLVASPVPPYMGLFVYGPATTQVPFGNGYRCVDGGSIGLARLPPEMPSGNVLSHDLDFSAPPFAAATITPGSTWHFQAWFRDPSAGGAGFDLSDGLSVTFIP